MSDKVKGTQKPMDNNGLQDNGNPEGGKETKPSIAQRISSKWHSFRSTTGGRWAIRITKGVAGGAALLGAYNLGKKSVQPVTVYVTPVEEPKAEEPTEETPTEKSEEVEAEE